MIGPCARSDWSKTHVLLEFLFYANVINSCLFGISFPIVSDTSLSFFVDAGHHAPQITAGHDDQRLQGTIKKYPAETMGNEIRIDAEKNDGGIK